MALLALLACSPDPEDSPPNDSARAKAATDSVDWKLAVHDTSGASLTSLPGQPGVFRVTMPTSSGVRWHVQLNGPGVPLTLGETYVVTFRARAFGTRSISVGVAQAHVSWENLGFYRDVAVDTTWKSFSERFNATASDTRTRLHFDLGVSAETVELTEMSIRAVRPGQSNDSSARTNRP